MSDSRPRRHSRLGPWTLAALLCGCVETRTERISSPEAVPPVVGINEASWRVTAGGELVGFVRRYSPEHRDPAAPEEAGYGPWYAVQNRWAQELGLIDELGRAWRLRPHRSGPEWVGTGTVAEGVAEVLELDENLELEPLEPAPR